MNYEVKYNRFFFCNYSNDDGPGAIKDIPELNTFTGAKQGWEKGPAQRFIANKDSLRGLLTLYE